MLLIWLDSLFVCHNFVIYTAFYEESESDVKTYKILEPEGGNIIKTNVNLMFSIFLCVNPHLLLLNGPPRFLAQILARFLTRFLARFLTRVLGIRKYSVQFYWDRKYSVQFYWYRKFRKNPYKILLKAF